MIMKKYTVYISLQYMLFKFILKDTDAVTLILRGRTFRTKYKRKENPSIEF